MTFRTLRSAIRTLPTAADRYDAWHRAWLWASCAGDARMAGDIHAVLIRMAFSRSF